MAWLTWLAWLPWLSWLTWSSKGGITKKGWSQPFHHYTHPHRTDPSPEFNCQGCWECEPAMLVHHTTWRRGSRKIKKSHKSKKSWFLIPKPLFL
jgi:hypothetical protein